MVAIRIKVNTDAAVRRVKRIKSALADLRPFWQNEVKSFLRDEFLKVFRSNGRGTWLPTTRPNPILRDTRKLFTSYTVAGSMGNINRANRDRYIYGSSIDYAAVHEYGSSRRNIPARPVARLVASGQGFDAGLSRLANTWISRRLGRI